MAMLNPAARLARHPLPRLICLGLAVAVMSVVIAACGSNKSSSGGETKASGGGTTSTSGTISTGTGSAGDPGSSSTTTPTTATGSSGSGSGSGSASGGKTDAGKHSAKVPRPSPAHPSDHPVNLTATPSIKADLLKSVRAFAATAAGFRTSTVTGPEAGSTFYAGQGGFEYAQASFNAPGSRGSDVGHPVATAYRRIGHPWQTYDIGNYSDISPMCVVPQQVNKMWNAQAPSNPCGLSWNKSDREFSDVTDTLRCTTRDDGEKKPWLGCGAFAPDKSTSIHTAFLQAKSDTSVPTDGALSLQPSTGMRIAYGVSTAIVMRSMTYTCLVVPGHLSCSDDSGRAINISGGAMW